MHVIIIIASQANDADHDSYVVIGLYRVVQTNPMSYSPNKCKGLQGDCTLEHS